MLIEDNPENNMINEALIRNWNQDIEVSIIDNSSEILSFFEREFSRPETSVVRRIFFE